MKTPISVLFAALTLTFLNVGCKPQARAENPVEVGTVAWERDYNAAAAAAKTTGKPIFALFQEVPGCAGCKRFGRDVLSDPSVVKLIQENFIPLLIHNNKPGKDAEVLERFHETAWNYQVVRFLDSSGRDLIPRKERVWEGPELVQRMAQGLEKAGRPKPVIPETRRVAIAQPCFWSGEMKIGAIDGVKRTEAGYLDGHEVTMVDFDPAMISLDELTRKAKAEKVATQVYTSLDGYRRAPESDQKYHLQGTRFERMKLTPEQATKVNAFVLTAPERAEAVVAK